MDDQCAGRRVVAGVDGSDSALEAVRWAAREAARRRVPLRLVAVVGGPAPVHTFGDPTGGPDERGVLRRRARTYLTHAEQAAREAAPGTALEREVVEGSPIPRLVAESQAAGLVVLGDRGLGGVTGLLVGSVAFALGAQGSCPVVVVRGRAAADGPVVVGVDGSPVSEAAVAFAFDAAAARHVPLVAVHAWWDWLIDPVTLPSREEERVLAERLAGWREKYPDVEVERLVTEAPPARALVEQSRRAQLVVVGSHGRGGAAGLVLGSVSHAVTHRADCPVVIVRGQGPAGG